MLKNTLYLIGSNVVSLLISAIVIAVVPKTIGNIEYGYFQLYLFYTSYIGFLHLGLPDGLYLRYGGKDYDDLDKKSLTLQFWLVVLFITLISLGVFYVATLYSGNTNKIYVIFMTCICALVMLPRTFLVLLLQATNRIKEFTKITIIEKLVYLVIIFIMLLSSSTSYTMLIKADLIGKICSILYAGYICKDIVLAKVSIIKSGLIEALCNIRVGSKVMVSNIASMLVIGIVRLGIELKWSIETFGKLSLTLSISNLFMIFINAISITIFPLLCNLKQDELSKGYELLRTLLMLPLFLLLIFYYPVKVILTAWLPNYSESLSYMAILFPVCVYECKMSILITPYLKSLRKEKTLLLINLVCVFCSISTTILTVFIFKNLYIAIISMVILLELRCVLSEIMLSKCLDIRIMRDSMLENILCSIFMLVGWFINNYFFIVVYGLSYITYLLCKQKDISKLLVFLSKHLNINKKNKLKQTFDQS